MKKHKVGKHFITDVIKDRHVMIAAMERRIEAGLNDIADLEANTDKDDMYSSYSLRGKSTDEERLSKTNSKTDLHGILETYEKHKQYSIRMHTEIVRNAMDELELIQKVYQIYMQMNHRVFNVLQALYEYGDKWGTVTKDYGLSNRQISNVVTLGVMIVQYELENGMDSSKSDVFRGCEEYRRVYLSRGK